MGDLIFGSYRDQNQELKRKAIEIIEEKRNEIIDFFNFHGNLEKPNGPRDDKTLNMDKAIEKKFYPCENRYKLHLRIYNIPGIFRKNDGLFEIIGETLMIFQLFFNKFNDINDKNEYQKKFEEFFNALIKADNLKIYDMIGLNIEDTDLVRKKQGLESLMEIFGAENLKAYYKSVFIGEGIGTACLAALGSFLAWEIGAALTATAVTPIAIAILAGVIGYFIWDSAKEKNIQNVTNNVNKIQDFYNKIQDFLSKGADYFCNDDDDAHKDGDVRKDGDDSKVSDKNLFVIAYKKRSNNLIEEICMFPYYLEGIWGINCPTIGKKGSMGSNSDYYRIVLDACQYYVKTFKPRVYLHINKNPQPNLQSEIQDEFNFLRTATISQIEKKINLKEKVESNIANRHLNLANGIQSSEDITTNDSINTSQFDQENGNQMYYHQGEQYDYNQIDMQPDYS